MAAGAVKTAFIEVFRCRSQPWLWVVPVSSIVLAVVGTFLLTVGQELKTNRDWGFAIGGAVLVLLGGLVQWLMTWAERAQRVDESLEAERLRVAMKDALQPVAELIADMPALSPVKRQERLGQVAQQSVGAIRLLLDGVDRLRAVVYALEDPPTRMRCLAYYGRGSRPGDFLAATERGDSALSLVSQGKDLFVNDLSANRPAEYGGSASDYQTFISASITTGSDAFGMVTVDAPEAGALVDTDRQIVLLVADLLAIAFAIADRS